ncbi:FecCD family ABC transporter permease [Streptomyces sp. ST2-7A]|uniref:FecCD family ABC transporter permease n=1 Tax=Streptomyces sp. ST2-7A TaxID=2907214 RepID=UPI0035AB746B
MDEPPVDAHRPGTRSRGPVLRGPLGLSLRVHPRGALVLPAILLTALGTAVVLVGTGDYPLTPAEVIDVLLGGGTPGQRFVIHELRLPRALLALLVGLALGLAGAVFQAVSRNPLGSPDIIGFTQGAGVGALTVIVVFGGDAGAVSLGAVAGGLLTGVLVYLLAWRRGIHGYRLVLVGIGAAAILTAVNGYLMTRADIVDAARAVLWITGSLNGRGWAQLWPLLIACAVLVPLILSRGRRLTLLEMGDDSASSLGVRPESTRLVVLVGAVLLTAVATAAAGPIAFVALTAPQLARRLTRTPGPNLLPAAAMGALVLCAADLVAQAAFGDRQLPVGAVTGILGGGYLLWLLAVERRSGRL